VHGPEVSTYEVWKEELQISASVTELYQFIPIVTPIYSPAVVGFGLENQNATALLSNPPKKSTERSCQNSRVSAVQGNTNLLMIRSQDPENSPHPAYLNRKSRPRSCGVPTLIAPHVRMLFTNNTSVRPQGILGREEICA
jgi:hypothetical protein